MRIDRTIPVGWRTRHTHAALLKCACARERGGRALSSTRLARIDEEEGRYGAKEGGSETACLVRYTLGTRQPSQWTRPSALFLTEKSKSMASIAAVAIAPPLVSPSFAIFVDIGRFFVTPRAFARIHAFRMSVSV